MSRTHKKASGKTSHSLIARLPRTKMFLGIYTITGIAFVAVCSLVVLTNVQGDSMVGNLNKDTASKSTAFVKSATASTEKTKTDEKEKSTTKKSNATNTADTAPAASNAPPSTPIVTSFAKPSWTNRSLYVDSYNGASTYVAAHPSADGARQLARMGQQSVARWFGGWDSNVNAAVSGYVGSAAASGAAPVLVLYNIPGRDCGSYSAGGSASDTAYLAWVRQVTAGIAGRTAVVILEPDALAGADCLSTTGQQGRFQLLAQAVTILKSQPNTAVYLDAGNPNWQSVTTMASRLNSANIAAADGFSLNVSNFASTSSNIAYGESISNLVGGKHYVIDTSRNGGNANLGNGPFNPPSAALGQSPTTRTASNRADAYLWVKTPWESDGPANGGPAAGQPFWSYAVQLARNAGW